MQKRGVEAIEKHEIDFPGETVAGVADLASFLEASASDQMPPDLLAQYGGDGSSPNAAMSCLTASPHQGFPQSIIDIGEPLAESRHREGSVGHRRSARDDTQPHGRVGMGRERLECLDQAIEVLPLEPLSADGSDRVGVLRGQVADI